MKKLLLILTFIMVFASMPGAAAPGDASGYMKELHTFDISCRALEGGFEKRTCGIRHIGAYTTLIRLEDRAATLEAVEKEIKTAKERLAGLEEIESAAPAQEFSQDYEDMVFGAQAGDADAAARLAATDDMALIPYLLRVLEVPGAIPNESILNKLSELENKMDAALEAGGGLDSAVAAAAVKRESNYIEALKRAVIALEGTRRKFPPWLPFAYAYLVGLIPFGAGIFASVKYYGRLEGRVIAISAAVYLIYVCMHGYFQFIAPYH